jgi:hypothetical protein
MVQEIEFFLLGLLGDIRVQRKRSCRPASYEFRLRFRCRVGHREYFLNFLVLVRKLVSDDHRTDGPESLQAHAQVPASNAPTLLTSASVCLPPFSFILISEINVT